MNKALIEISLISNLILSASVTAAENVDKKSAGLLQEKARVERVLTGQRQRAALGRSVSEFAEEFALFDNQLYGRLRGVEDNQPRVLELKSNLENMNRELERVTAGSPEGGNLTDSGESVLRPQDEGAFKVQVEDLENEILETNRELDYLLLGSLPAAGTELLDSSIWTVRDELSRDAATLDELVEIYESYSETLDKMLKQDKTLRPEPGKEKNPGKDQPGGNRRK